MHSSEQLRLDLVDALTASGAIVSGSIRNAFLSVPRELFVPDIAQAQGLEYVYADQPLIVQQRDGVATSSSSQPTIMAQMLEALEVRPGHRVLEVGLGTGYNASLLSLLVGVDGRVASVDIDDGLVRDASTRLQSAGYSVDAAAVDGRDGYPAGAPYDRIIATASTETIPQSWWDQLHPNGLLIVPLRVEALQVVAVLERTPDGFRTRRLIPGGFMPLRGNETGPLAQTVGAVMVRADVPGQPGKVRTRSVTGPGLVRLSTRAQRKMVVSLMTKPDSVPLDPQDVVGLIWHTALTSDPQRQVTVYLDEPGWRFGLFDQRSGSFSIFLGKQGTLLALESYGNDPRCRAELMGHLDRWRRAGAPGLDRLALQISYGPAAPGSQTRRSHTFKRSDQLHSFTWDYR